MRLVLSLCAVAFALAGCDDSSSPEPKTARPPTAATGGTTPPAQTTTPAGNEIRVYFLREGKVAPVARTAPNEGVAAAALVALGDGPTAEERGLGLTTAIPDDTPPTVRIAKGVATVDLRLTYSHAAIAQLVYTLTQFPTVDAVRPTRAIVGSESLTRADFEDVTPSILVESPLPFAGVTSPLDVRGTANTFEATLNLEVVDSSGRQLFDHFFTATSGSGTRGTFNATVRFAATGRVTLVAYETSAANGRRIHVVRIPLDAR